MSDGINYALWLLPEAAQAHKYSAVIADLAEAFDAPSFKPHVTVYGGQTRDLDQTLGQFGSLQAKPIQLICKGSFQSERFTQTFGLSFEPNAQLSLLSAQMAKHPANIDRAYQLCPHMSLIYAHLAETERLRLVERVDLPSEPIHFNQLALVTPGPQNDWHRVASWQVLQLRNL